MTTGYIMTAYRPRTDNTPQVVPRVGDLFEVEFWPTSPTLYRVGRVEKARAGIDDINADGVAISHHYRVDYMSPLTGVFEWLELPAHYDAVRITTADYFANR